MIGLNKFSLFSINDHGVFKNLYLNTLSAMPTYEKGWAYLSFWMGESTLKYLDQNSLFIIHPVYSSSGWNISLIKPHSPTSCTIAMTILNELAQMQDINEITVRYIYEDELYSIKDVSNISLEERYPQIIYSTSEIISHSGSEWAPFRLRLNRFFNEHRHTFQIKHLKDTDKATAFKAVTNWRNSFANRDNYPNSNFSPDAEWYKNVIDFFYASNSNTDVSLLIEINKNPMAFGCISPISSQCMGVYANIASSEIKGLSEFLIYTLAKEATNIGFQQLNIGHTNRESEYIFKKKTPPFTTFPVYVATLQGTQNNNNKFSDLVARCKEQALY